MSVAGSGSTAPERTHPSPDRRPAGERERTAWLCPACGKSMATEGGYRIHVTVKHPDNAPSESSSVGSPSSGSSSSGGSFGNLGAEDPAPAPVAEPKASRSSWRERAPE